MAPFWKQQGPFRNRLEMNTGESEEWGGFVSQPSEC